MAERVGFEPTCPLRDKTLSRRPRYDHFGTSPVNGRLQNFQFYQIPCVRKPFPAITGEYRPSLFHMIVRVAAGGTI